MKRLIPILLLFFLLPLSCRAYEAESALKELYDRLPEEIVEALPDEIGKDIQNGDTASLTQCLDLSFLWDRIGQTLLGALVDTVGLFSLLLGTLFLASLMRAASGAVGNTAEQTVGLVSLLVTVTILLRAVKPAWDTATATLRSISTLLSGSLPVMTGLLVASGHTSLSATHASWLSALLTLIEALCDAVLSPLFAICFGFLLVSALSRYTGVPDLGGTVSAVKKLFNTLLALAATVFTTVMTFQHSLAQRADSVLLRSVKFASGHLIPVIGGALSETADSYLASLSLIRSTAGMLTAVSVVLLVLPAICHLLLLRAALGIASGLAGLLGCQAEGDCLREASELLDPALALLAMASAIFFIVIGLFSFMASTG
ncbi:MAG: hypothetical protein E7618_00830 [Ruminococcaceae bacterium]|nr:hypothetical protein [Oscillospiraceae bacterium]